MRAAIQQNPFSCHSCAYDGAEKSETVATSQSKAMPSLARTSLRTATTIVRTNTMHPMVVICPSTLPTISSIRQVSFLRIPSIPLLLLYVVLDLANLVGILIPPLYLVGVLLLSCSPSAS